MSASACLISLALSQFPHEARAMAFQALDQRPAFRRPDSGERTNDLPDHVEVLFLPEDRAEGRHGQGAPQLAEELNRHQAVFPDGVLERADELRLVREGVIVFAVFRGGSSFLIDTQLIPLSINIRS